MGPFEAIQNAVPPLVAGKGWRRWNGTERLVKKT